ncbi:MAG: nucleotide exchange factor GrpE [Tannerella sp.]|jgi:molecular chaperone GrpE|nr:nucleotide exchange factor GrpE [Tannerella sp.]
MESTAYTDRHSEDPHFNETDDRDVTNLQENGENMSDDSPEKDNLTDTNKESTDNEQDKVLTEPSLEEKYASLNDFYLRLMAEYDNYRKRTIREKADLIKNGGETALKNILPVVDDFDRALDTLKKTEVMQSVIDGIQLIYDKFISYLLQQGVKRMDVVGTPFDADMYEAIATFPVPEEDKKGKVIDCVQAGYMMYDKVLRHAKVVVGE